MPTDPRDVAGTPGRAVRPLTGRTVGGRYRLDAVLGRGGMGMVWAGHDELLHRDVAIKEVVLPSGVDEEQRDALRARTMREARTAARIWADGSVAIYDVVEDDGRPWIVMERLPSRTLADELEERGAIPPREVAEIGSSLLAGLSAAHAAGILHRDVKPSNVMFRGGPGGRRAVLGDFGIAHFDGDATLTSTGMMMGSPAYVAPERAHGKPATAASDLWALGVTLWTAVEGRSPFQRENALATLTAVITEDVPTAENAGPMQTVLEGLLAKDPARRIDGATARKLLTAVVASGTTPPPLADLAPTAPTERMTSPPATTVAVPPPAPVGTPWWTPAEAGPTERHAPVETDEQVEAQERARRRRRWRVPLLAVLIPGLVGLGAVLLQPDGDEVDDPAAAQQEQVSPTPTPEAQVVPPATQTTEPDPASSDPAVGAGAAGAEGAQDQAAEPAPEPAPAPEPVVEPEPEAPAAPPGFELYTDETGFSVAVPEGWQVERDPPRVYLSDPASSAYLLVDQSDQPKADPVADWKAQESSVAARLPNYQLVRDIVGIDFRGWRGADWEFVFGQSQGTHVLNRNLVTSPTQAYALYWSVPSSQWEAMRPVHEQVVNSFQPGE